MFALCLVCFIFLLRLAALWVLKIFPVWWLLCGITRRRIDVCSQPWTNWIVRFHFPEEWRQIETTMLLFLPFVLAREAELFPTSRVWSLYGLQQILQTNPRSPSDHMLDTCMHINQSEFYARGQGRGKSTNVWQLSKSLWLVARREVASRAWTIYRGEENRRAQQ